MCQRVLLTPEIFICFLLLMNRKRREGVERATCLILIHTPIPHSRVEETLESCPALGWTGKRERCAPTPTHQQQQSTIIIIISKLDRGDKCGRVALFMLFVPIPPRQARQVHSGGTRCLLALLRVSIAQCRLWRWVHVQVRTKFPQNRFGQLEIWWNLLLLL
jgi:hypothetical protein